MCEQMLADEEARWELLGTISDMYKDLYGVRPRGLFVRMSLAEVIVVAERLSGLLSEHLNSAEYREQVALEEAWIAKMDADYEAEREARYAEEEKSLMEQMESDRWYDEQLMFRGSF